MELLVEVAIYAGGLALMFAAVFGWAIMSVPV